MMDKYFINFTLGDPNNDGHGLTSFYHMVSNYSVIEITEAYNNTCDKLGFDFIKSVMVDYDDSIEVPINFTGPLLALGIIDRSKVTDEGTYEFEYAEDEFLQIFENIIKYSLPEFKWESVKIEGEQLMILEGAGYGLFSL